MVGYNAQCKLCNWGERMKEDGASLKQIVDFLSNHGVTLSKPAVKRHFDTHFAMKEEATKRYHEQSGLSVNRRERLTELEILDVTI